MRNSLTYSFSNRHFERRNVFANLLWKRFVVQQVFGSLRSVESIVAQLLPDFLSIFDWDPHNTRSVVVANIWCPVLTVDRKVSIPYLVRLKVSIFGYRDGLDPIESRAALGQRHGCLNVIFGQLFLMVIVRSVILMQRRLALDKQMRKLPLAKPVPGEFQEKRSESRVESTNRGLHNAYSRSQPA